MKRTVGWFACVGCALALQVHAAWTAEANRMAELRFESAKTYADPFNEVTLDAVFTAPDGKTLRVPGFWDGGKTWCVRYASSVVGAHRFSTVCSDPANAALHGVVGEVNVTPYVGDNPLFRHGPVRVADDHRHFAYADGTPFFWLGDTWWMGLSERLHWPQDVQALAADRCAKGFTVVQIVAGLYPDMPAFDERGKGDGGFSWEAGYARIRPEYFDAADKRIQFLVEQGLMPCVVGAWGYHLPWLGADKLKQHWRYVIARWGAWPVVWCAAGEQAMPWYLAENKAADSERQRREWTEIIRTIRATDAFHRPVTTHPRCKARDDVADASVLDFEMHQSGHGTPPEGHAALALEGWRGQPVMPVLSGEARYEALEIHPTLGAKEARQAFWAHLLNCGCAGHTYGANGIWQVNQPDRRYGKSPGGNDWGGTPWSDALRLPGSAQLALAKKFLLTQPWYRLEPVGGTFVKGDTAAAATPDKRCALVFTLGQAVTVDWTGWPASARAAWFDPTTGELRALDGDLPATGTREFAPPGKNGAGDGDWVLLISGAAK